MKRTPIGHIRRHYVACKDCDQLGKTPVKVKSVKGEEVEWRACTRCSGSGMMLESMETLETQFAPEETKPKVGEKAEGAGGKPL